MGRKHQNPWLEPTPEVVADLIRDIQSGRIPVHDEKNAGVDEEGFAEVMQLAADDKAPIADYTFSQSNPGRGVYRKR